MAKYKFAFWFEWGNSKKDCNCLWSQDDVTKDKYGYNVDISELPVSEDLIKLLFDLGMEHDESLDWSDPGGPSPWTDEQEQDFAARKAEARRRLQEELGSEYEIL
ncbi:MAG: hypothetical protein K2G32_06800 [Oscillospiraceae bacterium]|nr:hypothetical protein [Oscillospiraceae bacterium]